MAFIQEGSYECTKSELDLFSLPPTQTSIESGNLVEFHPISTITEGTPIEFDVSSSGDMYLDFTNSHLFVQAKILRADGTDLHDGDTVGPVNNFLHSLFSQVDISLNSTLVTSSTNTYAYRAYIENLLSYGVSAKTSQLTAALFYKDEAGKMDETNPHVDPAANRNAGLHKRAGLTDGSRSVDMIGRLHADIFFQTRYMLNEVNVKIKLSRSKDSFCLMAEGAQAFKVTITKAALFMRKVTISPSIYLAHSKALELGMAKYPIRRIICKTFTIPAGYLDASNEKLYSGQLPSRLIIGCVSNSAFNGRLNSNPFNFKHYNLSEIAVYLDGQQHGIKPLHCNYNTGEYIQSFMTLFNGTGKCYRDEGNDISRGDYNNGYALYAFDLTPDLCDSEHFNLTRHGRVVSD